MNAESEWKLTFNYPVVLVCVWSVCVWDSVCVCCLCCVYSLLELWSPLMSSGLNNWLAALKVWCFCLQAGLTCSLSVAHTHTRTQTQPTRSYHHHLGAHPQKLYLHPVALIENAPAVQKPMFLSFIYTFSSRVSTEYHFWSFSSVKFTSAQFVFQIYTNASWAFLWTYFTFLRHGF